MSRRGLRVVTPTASELEAWNRQADDVNRSVRGRYLPAEAYDELVRALDEFRRRPARAAK
jgi:hypothetical protein